MLIVIAASAVAFVAAEPPKHFTSTKRIDVRGACAAGIIDTSSPPVRFDHEAPYAGGVDRQPDREAPVLYSAVERKVDGCSLPVIRVRTTVSPAPVPLVVPIER